MSTLQKLPKLCSFVEAQEPDNQIQTKEVARENVHDVIRTPRVLQSGSFSWSVPEPRKKYVYLSSSPQALADLGLAPAEDKSPEFQQIVSGEIYQKNFEDLGLPFPYAQAYAGWQFGQFAGQLGDGRVHNLFEVVKPAPASEPTPDAKSAPKSSPTFDNNRRTYEIQLKGSGMTPYSRFADGKAVVRSSIREYIISEHLNAIGIPSTRALALTYLPQTYAQRHGAEKCAIVARFAESWIRLGSFDLHRWRHDVSDVRRLSQYVIDELFTLDNGATKFPFFSDMLSSRDDFFEASGNSVGALTDFDKMYYEIIVRNATTTAMWQSYGFLNGVLNTDNTSVLGLSMDFGPFAIMDKLDRKFTPNSEDHMLRYSYANTPTAIWWNLTRLGEDIAHLIGAGEKLINDDRLMRGAYGKEDEERLVKRAMKVIEIGGEIYQYAFTKKYVETLFKRLGLSEKLITTNNPDLQNDELISPLIDMLEKVQCDYNKFFITLQNSDVTGADFDADKFARNILVKASEEKSDNIDEELVKTITEWIGIYRQYAIKAGVDKNLSTSANPQFLPRSWILNEVIQKPEESEGQDLAYLHKLEKMAFNPYDPSLWGDDLKEVEKKWVLQGDMGDDYSMLQCSCSS
ncbi:hypothetical protein JCM33374_g5156 [Metschnikowia sp. JCM 33374]|nr:hypothetical protein JCM33374_g5156 [Metschnikowia sp. JCM 33374]